MKKPESADNSSRPRSLNYYTDFKYMTNGPKESGREKEKPADLVEKEEAGKDVDTEKKDLSRYVL